MLKLGSVDFQQSCKEKSMEKIYCLQQIITGQLDIKKQNSEVEFLLHTYANINTKWITVPNVGTKKLKLMMKTTV